MRNDYLAPGKGFEPLIPERVTRSQIWRLTRFGYPGSTKSLLRLG